MSVAGLLDQADEKGVPSVSCFVANLGTSAVL